MIDNYLYCSFNDPCFSACMLFFMNRVVPEGQQKRVAEEILVEFQELLLEEKDSIPMIAVKKNGFYEVEGMSTALKQMKTFFQCGV